jgi:glycosyltransferase 2 family protein
MSRKKLILLLRVAVSCGILAYLIATLDWQRLLRVFSEIRLEYVWFAPLLLIAGLYSLAVRWSILLKHFGIFLNPKESFIYYLIGNFYNIILPGSIGGDVIRASICTIKQNKPLSLIASSAFLERVFGLLVVLFLGSIGILCSTEELRQQLGKTLTGTVLWFSLGNLFIFAIFWLSIGFIPWQFLEAKIGKNKIVSTLADIFDRIHNISIADLFLILAFNLFAQLFDIAASYSLAQSISFNLPPIVFVIIIPIVYISTALPISLGGLGVREGVLALLLSRVGIAASDAITFSFIIYLNRVFVASIGGIIQIFWQLPVKNDR